MKDFTIQDKGFCWKDEPVQLVSGGIHYFRVHPDYWADRLDKIKALGCNCVETYVPWNRHEEQEGLFNFSGRLDLSRFLSLAAERGLWAIVRPGPYICAEWDGGGLPAWLLTKEGMRVRRWNKPFREALEKYLLKVFAELKPWLEKSVIMMQVENEYGAFVPLGGDPRYLRSLRDFYQRHLGDLPLFTSDQPVGFMQRRGGIPGVLRTGNFGSRARERFSLLRRYQKRGPLMCMEFWVGWFDHWGGAHHTNPAERSAAALAELLDLGGSVNIYLVQGGTNFALSSGADFKYGKYWPTVTSYDYDAPLTEDGRITEKYRLYHRILQERGLAGELPLFEEPPRLPETEVVLEGAGEKGLFQCRADFSKREPEESPLSFEEMRMDTGVLLYRHTLEGSRGEKGSLVLPDFHDRVYVYLNGKRQALRYRNEKKRGISLHLLEGANSLEILVENMGRINYGRHTLDAKGLLGPVYWKRAGGRRKRLSGWIHRGYSLQEKPRAAEGVPAGREEPGFSFSWTGPRLGEGSFYVKAEERGDTFAEIPEGTKGFLFVNGECLGRYWNQGPQKRLYLPSPWLREGKNSLAVLELEGGVPTRVVLWPKPDLG